MRPEELIKIRYQDEWFEHVSDADAARYNKRNVQRCREAMAYHDRKDRPLGILAVYGSGRGNSDACARELSNSQLLLRGALEQFRGEPDKYEIVELTLRDYAIESCNNCYASTSALCGFPCDSIAVHQQILTGAGWKSLGVITEGETVLDGSGFWHRTLAQWVKEKKPVFRVETDEGYSVTGTAEHEIYLCNGSRRPLASLTKGDKLQLVLPNTLLFSPEHKLPGAVGTISTTPVGLRGGFKTRKKKRPICAPKVRAF